MDWGIGALGLRFKRFRVLGWVGVLGLRVRVSGLRFKRLGVLGWVGVLGLIGLSGLGYWDGLGYWGFGAQV